MIERLRNKNKKGSSLMFVIIAVAFVGILSTIVLRVTSINIETKSTDRTLKKNFYSTEEGMDKLNIALENITQDAMKKAYVDLLENYTSDGINTTDQSSVQRKFAENYLNELLNELAGTSIPASYTLGDGVKYDVEKIKNAMETAFNKNVADMFITEKDDALLSLTYDPGNYDAENYLTLKNIKVKYVKDNLNASMATSTWITTDIKLVVPKLNFEGANIYPDFTKYAIIGDEKVDALYGVTDAKVNGNVYAGADGLNVCGSGDTLSIGGSSSRLVVRGDIQVQQSGGLTLGSRGNPIEVWAENYRTSILKDGKDALAKLTVYGDSYIHDDLTLDGPYSDVNFEEGKYFGYSFNKDNTADSVTKVNSQYSSAIMINGKNSSLFMGDNMTEILLGGRAFISRNKDDRAGEKTFERPDIALGESISIKSNQNFYLVSNDDLAEGFTNPMTKTKYQTLMDENKEVMSTAAKRTLRNYVDASEPVTDYVYSLSSGSEDAAMVYFYYNFKSQSAADKYFRDFCDKNEMKKKIISSEYLRFSDEGGKGLTISESLTLLTAGNSLSFSDKSASLKSDEAKITDDNEDYYKKESITKAAKYKSYQMTLTESDWSKYAQSGMSDGDDGFDMKLDERGKKTFDPVFDKLITKNASGEHTFIEEANLGEDYGFFTLNGSVKYKAVPVDVGTEKVYAIFVVETDKNQISTENQMLTTVNMTDIMNKAKITSANAMILVSNCNININENVRGLVISDYLVSFYGTNLEVKAEPALLQNMFSKQKSLEGSVPLSGRFLKYFVAFSGMSFGKDVGTAQDSVDFSSYIKYVNWKKNND